MCRFLLYLGPHILLSDLIIKPSNSLIHQSYESEEREEPLNGDGFGVAWYNTESNEPGIFRSTSPAWSNNNLYHLSRGVRSHSILAHVRAASSKHSVSEVNCHPFIHHTFTFMHNGDLAGFKENRRTWLTKLSDYAFDVIQGNTDSEFLFAYFLDKYSTLSHVENIAERMAQALSICIHDVVAWSHASHNIGDQKSYLNIAISDGKHAVVSRYTTHEEKFAESLHIHSGKVYRCIGDAAEMIEPEAVFSNNDKLAGTKKTAVIISSEKLNSDNGWEIIPSNHLAIVEYNQTVKLKAI